MVVQTQVSAGSPPVQDLVWVCETVTNFAEIGQQQYRRTTAVPQQRRAQRKCIPQCSKDLNIQ